MWLIPQEKTSTLEERWAWFLEHYTPQIIHLHFTNGVKIIACFYQPQQKFNSSC